MVHLPPTQSPVQFGAVYRIKFDPDKSLAKALEQRFKDKGIRADAYYNHNEGSRKTSLIVTGDEYRTLESLKKDIPLFTKVRNLHSLDSIAQTANTFVNKLNAMFEMKEGSIDFETANHRHLLHDEKGIGFKPGKLLSLAQQTLKEEKTPETTKELQTLFEDNLNNQLFVKSTKQIYIRPITVIQPEENTSTHI